MALFSTAAGFSLSKFSGSCLSIPQAAVVPALRCELVAKASLGVGFPFLSVGAQLDLTILGVVVPVHVFALVRVSTSVSELSSCD